MNPVFYILFGILTATIGFAEVYFLGQWEILQEWAIEPKESFYAVIFIAIVLLWPLFWLTWIVFHLIRLK